jgi:dihydrofolate reductase
MGVVLVAAVARDGAIGKGNDLLFRISEDQRRFRRETLGHPVIMGRKTWDSLPARFRPLPGRRNIVVTRNAQWQADGAERAASLDEALVLAAGADKICVIGGGELYALALPLADQLVMTEVDAVVPGADTFFPGDRSGFFEAERERRITDDGLRYDFVTYQRQR